MVGRITGAKAPVFFASWQRIAGLPFYAIAASAAFNVALGRIAREVFAKSG
jgi:hypothetical protein